MKIINKILDNYFTKKFVDYIVSEVMCRYRLDSNIVIWKAEYVEIQFKPLYYSVYTTIFNFHKKDSLMMLIKSYTVNNFILNEIGRIDRNKLWKK